MAPQAMHLYLRQLLHAMGHCSSSPGAAFCMQCCMLALAHLLVVFGLLQRLVGLEGTFRCHRACCSGVQRLRECHDCTVLALAATVL
jgi:hypothetical protein